MLRSYFYEDNIRVVAINSVEELYLHSMSFSYMSSITNDEDGLLVGDHSEPSLEDGFSSHESIGLKDGQREVWKSSEGLSLLPMYSYTMTSRIASSSFEYREAFAITMEHLGLLFSILATNYNLHLNLMLPNPYDSLGVTYSQAFSVSFRHVILFGLKFKSKEHHSLSNQCILVVLHGLRIHHAIVPELVEYIPLLPKKNIPPDVLI